MKEEYYIRSEITGRSYNLFCCVKILNVQQAIFYIEHRVKLMDLVISKDRKSEKPVLVFIFNKEDTREAYDLWCNRKVDNND